MAFELPTADQLLASQSWKDSTLCVHDDGRVRIQASPFGPSQYELPLTLVGLTPGPTQAEAAWRIARRVLMEGNSMEAALVAVKANASFSGPLRSNLNRLLEAVGIPPVFGLSTATDLWRGNAIGTTSLLRFPVLAGERPYNGAPAIARHPALRLLMEDLFVPQVKAGPEHLWIALGKPVAQALSEFGLRGHLLPLPHPSGANGGDIAAFLRSDAAPSGRLQEARRVVANWAETLTEKSSAGRF